jgi:hypothetical protein
MLAVAVSIVTLLGAAPIADGSPPVHPHPDVLCGNCDGGSAPPYACNEHTGTYGVTWAGGKWFCVQGVWWYDGPA